MPIQAGLLQSLTGGGNINRAPIADVGRTGTPVTGRPGAAGRGDVGAPFRSILGEDPRAGIDTNLAGLLAGLPALSTGRLPIVGQGLPSLTGGLPGLSSAGLPELFGGLPNLRNILRGEGHLTRGLRDPTAGLGQVLQDPTSRAFRDASINPLRNAFLEDVLPRIGDDERFTGQRGGSRGDLSRLGAGERYSRSVGDLAANVNQMLRQMKFGEELQTRQQIFNERFGEQGQRFEQALGTRGQEFGERLSGRTQLFDERYKTRSQLFNERLSGRSQLFNEQFSTRGQLHQEQLQNRAQLFNEQLGGRAQLFGENIGARQSVFDQLRLGNETAALQQQLQLAPYQALLGQGGFGRGRRDERFLGGPSSILGSYAGFVNPIFGATTGQSQFGTRPGQNTLGQDIATGAGAATSLASLAYLGSLF